MALRLAENIVYSQPLGMIAMNIGQYGQTLLPSIGGPSVGGYTATGVRVLAGAKKEGVKGVGKALLDSYLRGDLPRIGPIKPLPLGSDIARILHAANK